MTKTLLRFQLVNLLVSIGLWLGNPGAALVMWLFIAKMVALMWFNRFPRSHDIASILFFALACIEIYLIFAVGSFSIYSYLLRRFG